MFDVVPEITHESAPSVETLDHVGLRKVLL
jgi:hypothetical protein